MAFADRENGWEVGEQQAADAFAGPESTALVGPASSTITTQDGVISAQRVGVERSLPKVMATLKTLAAMAGESWVYSFPVKGGTISGATIKLANDLSRTYGNCQVDVRAFDEGRNWIFYARFVDIETGYSLTRAFEQRKDQQSIKTPDKGRSENIAFQIGQSKAIRNVIVNALQTLADFCVEEANRNLIETIDQRIEDYREKVQGRLAEYKINVTFVESRVGRPVAEWTARDLAGVIAELQAINDGMANAIDLYPDPDAPERPNRGNRADDKAETPASEDQGYTLHMPDGSITPGFEAQDFLNAYDELMEGEQNRDIQERIEVANLNEVDKAELELKPEPDPVAAAKDSAPTENPENETREKPATEDTVAEEVAQTDG